MKKTVLIFLLALGLTGATQAQTLLHYWNFNNDSVATIHLPLAQPADYSLGSIRGLFLLKPFTGVVSDTGYLDNYAATDTTGESVNLRNGAAIGYAIRLRNPTDSEQVLLYMPTAHFKNIRIKFLTETSSATSGIKYQQYDYSTDSGANWKTSGLTTLYDTLGTGWGLVSENLSADTFANNNNRLVFRIRFLVQNTGSSGNNRFDNITVDGDSIIATGGGGGMHTAVNNVTTAGGYAVYPNPAGNALFVHSASAAKMIDIYTAAGKKARSIAAASADTQLDISGLTHGLYFIRITGADGAAATLRFIKE